MKYRGLYDSIVTVITDEQIEDCINEKIGVLLDLLTQVSPS